MPPSHPFRTPAAPFALTARVYDEIYAWKNYASEADRIRQLIRKYGPASPATLLDVACGTGSHLGFLSRWYQCTGVDASPGMLRVARQRSPDGHFVRARMEDFELEERFDAITCLFSAIAYVRNERDLRGTLQNFAAHLAPGGVAIVEPFIQPSSYRVGSIHAQMFGSEALPIARMNVSRKRGERAIMDMHHLVGTPEGVRYWVERHDLGLFGVPTYLAAFRAAGLRARYLKKGLDPERGLYVAVNPRRPV
jgi:ubiquinone/menaquinone biosynthesis C-methylase UbiE